MIDQLGQTIRLLFLFNRDGFNSSLSMPVSKYDYIIVLIVHQKRLICRTYNCTSNASMTSRH